MALKIQVKAKSNLEKMCEFSKGLQTLSVMMIQKW